MATRFMYKALLTAALGITLSLSLAAPTTASPAPANTAEAVELDPPAAPSNCTARSHYDRWKRETIVIVTWNDNSTDEDGFTLETWRRDVSGAWFLAGSGTLAANSTEAWVGFFPGRQVPQQKFRVRAFNAAGVSAWSNWGR